MSNWSTVAVIVPSRGRPEVVADMALAFKRTCFYGSDAVGERRFLTTRLHFAVDDVADDYDAYWSEVYKLRTSLRGPVEFVSVGQYPSTNMVQALNYAARRLVNPNMSGEFADTVMFMGDDHRPETPGWDAALDRAVDVGGIAYGNDMVQGRNLPTAVAMDADIVRALGYMAPPELNHMYVDNYWKALGEELSTLVYLDHVVIRHCHPITGDVEWTPGHVRVQEFMGPDGVTWSHMVEDGRVRDDARLIRSFLDRQSRDRLSDRADMKGGHGVP